MALSSPVVLVGGMASIQVGRAADVITGPQSAWVSGEPGKVMWIPQPAGELGIAEPSVNRRAVGSSKKGSAGPFDLAMYSSAFFIEKKRLTSEWMPMVRGLASCHDV